MDASDIARGGQRKRLLFYSASLLLLIMAVHLAGVPIASRRNEHRFANAATELCFLEYLLTAFVIGIFIICPAFLLMAFFKRLRDVRYFAAVNIFAIGSAVIGGITFYSLDLSHHPFPWRTPLEIRSDTVRGALIGFDLGLVGGAVLGAIAVPLLWRSRPLPPSVVEDKGVTGSENDEVPTGPSDATGIQPPQN